MSHTQPPTTTDTAALPRLGPRCPYGKREAVRWAGGAEGRSFGVELVGTDLEIDTLGLERAVRVKAARGCRRAQLGQTCSPACRALKPGVARYTAHPYEGRPCEDELHLTPFACARWGGRRRAEVPPQYVRLWLCTFSALMTLAWAALINPQAVAARAYGCDRTKADDAAHAARSALTRSYVPRVPDSGIIGIDGKKIPHRTLTVFADVIGKRPIEVLPGRPTKALSKLLSRLEGLERLRIVVIDGDSQLRKYIRKHLPWVVIVYDLFHHTRLLNDELCRYLKTHRPPKPEGVKRPKRGLARTVRKRWDKLCTADQDYLTALFRLDARFSLAYWYRETGLALLELDSEREDVAVWLMDWATHPPPKLADVYRASRQRCRRTWHHEIANISRCRALPGIMDSPTNGFVEGAINRYLEDRQRAGCGHTDHETLRWAALCRFRAISQKEFSSLMVGVARRRRRSSLRARRRYRRRKLMEAVHA